MDAVKFREMVVLGGGDSGGQTLGGFEVLVAVSESGSSSSRAGSVTVAYTVRILVRIECEVRP